MTTAVWDLDGTLLDSYDAIWQIEETYAHYDLDFDREGIHSHIPKALSSSEVLEKVASTKV